jgi:hypothetical protein
MIVVIVLPLFFVFSKTMGKISLCFVHIYRHCFVACANIFSPFSIASSIMQRSVMSVQATLAFAQRSRGRDD